MNVVCARCMAASGGGSVPGRAELTVVNDGEARHLAVGRTGKRTGPLAGGDRDAHSVEPAARCSASASKAEATVPRAAA